MTPAEYNKLLSDLLAERDLSDLRQKTLDSGLLALRQHRQRRRAQQTFVLTALPFILVSVILVGRGIRHWRVTSAGNSPSATVAIMQTLDTRVKVISDAELFALFPNRSLALVGKPGHQELVFLDQDKPTVPKAP